MKEHYGRSAALAVDAQENVYLGGSGDVDYFLSGNKRWYLSITLLSGSGDENGQIFIKPKENDGGYVDSESEAPYIDNMYYYDSGYSKRLFGSTRSHKEDPDRGMYLGFWMARMADDGELPSSNPHFV